MEVKISLPFKALTLNQAYTNIPGRGRIKSNAYRDWSSDVIEHLNFNCNDEYKTFQKAYDIFDSYITLDFVFYHKVFTKKQLISKTAGDTSNLVKCIEDQLAEFLMFDDSQVVALSATKVHADHDRIDVTLNVRPLASIR
jgi:Holliday junction resolvase RusA-like endonuclease